MKKGNCKRLLATVLSAACVLASSTMAFAAPGTDTIDTSQKCNLTIYKYDYSAAMEDNVDVTTMQQKYTDGKRHVAEVEM